VRIGAPDELLVHYSATAVRGFEPRTETQGRYKPKGLWVSVGEAWREWCEGEEYALDTLAVRHVVELAPEANILVLETADELDCFTARYLVEGTGWREDMVDWEQVSRSHQGVIVAPYQWSRRLELDWYYGWDCASGCIWDGDAIYAIREVAL
jgi:hypothetical protein